MDEPGWMDFYTAAAEIKQHCGGSLADAQALLRRACTDERIRSMKAPLDPERLPFEFWTRVAPSKWREGQPDYDGPDDDGCETVVMINQDDFRHWLGSEPKVAADNRRDAAIRKLLEAGQQPGHNVPWKVFCDDVRSDADGWHKGKPARGFGDKSISRAVELIWIRLARPKTVTLRRVDKRVS